MQEHFYELFSSIITNYIQSYNKIIENKLSQVLFYASV